MMKNNLKNKKIMRRSSKGITLIALVITIIVLLILAGVSILNNNKQDIRGQIKDNNTTFEQTIKAKDFEYYIKKVGNNE